MCIRDSLGHDAAGTFDLRGYEGPLEAGEGPVRTPAAFVARVRADDVIEAEEIHARLDDPSLVLLDARSRPRWRGDEEPLPTGAADPPELAVYCGSGVTAAVQVQRLVLAGRDDARLYPGSFSEWCRREDYPIERGEPEP